MLVNSPPGRTSDIGDRTAMRFDQAPRIVLVIVGVRGVAPPLLTRGHKISRIRIVQSAFVAKSKRFSDSAQMPANGRANPS